MLPPLTLAITLYTRRVRAKELRESENVLGGRSIACVCRGKRPGGAAIIQFCDQHKSKMLTFDSQSEPTHYRKKIPRWKSASLSKDNLSEFLLKIVSSVVAYVDPTINFACPDAQENARVVVRRLRSVVVRDLPRHVLL